MKVLEQKRQLERIRQNIDGYDTASERLRVEYRLACAEVPIDSIKVEQLLKAASMEGVQRDHLAQKHDELLVPYRKAALQLLEFAIREEANLAKLVVPVAIAARKEVEESVDEGIYAEILAADSGQDPKLVSVLFGVSQVPSPGHGAHSP